MFDPAKAQNVKMLVNFNPKRSLVNFHFLPLPRGSISRNLSDQILLRHHHSIQQQPQDIIIIFLKYFVIKTMIKGWSSVKGCSWKSRNLSELSTISWQLVALIAESHYHHFTLQHHNSLSRSFILSPHHIFLSLSTYIFPYHHHHHHTMKKHSDNKMLF